MKRILLAGATLLALTAAQPTLAADAPVYKGPAPVAAALFNWSGFYVGIQGGGAWGSSSISNTGGASTGAFDISGWLIGGTLGVNWQSGALVFGLEGDAAWADISGGSTVACGSTCTTKLNWLGTARGRIGFTTGPALIYLTGGGAFTRVAISSGNGVVRGASDKTGWTFGGGLEWMIAPNWTLKGEYLYVDFDRAANGVPLTTFADYARLHVFRAGVNYKF